MDNKDDALSKAKLQLMNCKEACFLMHVLFSLKHVWDEQIPTACTNGKEIRVNPEFFMELPERIRVSLLLHEALHVAFIHMARLNSRNSMKWNYAADYVINDILYQRGFTLGEGWLHDPQYAGLSTEEVYDLLPEPDPSANTVMMDLESPPKDDASGADLEESIREILIRASIQAKQVEGGYGSIPGELQIYIDNLLAPKLPWYRILQKFLTTYNKTNYSFRKPNRRYMPDHLLPTAYGKSLTNVAWGIDMSGSVSDRDTTVFVSEMAATFKMLRPKKMTMIQFDTKIKSVETLKSIKDLRNATFVGRGGTDIIPMLDWAIKNKPEVLIILTDGEFKKPPKSMAPQCPVIWVIHNNQNFTSHFGKVIHYTI